MDDLSLLGTRSVPWKMNDPRLGPEFQGLCRRQDLGEAERGS